MLQTSFHFTSFIRNTSTGVGRKITHILAVNIKEDNINGLIFSTPSIFSISCDYTFLFLRKVKNMSENNKYQISF